MPKNMKISMSSHVGRFVFPEDCHESSRKSNFRHSVALSLLSAVVLPPFEGGL
jgi:hypothetical protein